MVYGRPIIFLSTSRFHRTDIQKNVLDMGNGERPPIHIIHLHLRA
jgi:hypothetical protein